MKVYYAITLGLRGCYMPDTHFGAHAVSTRRELAALIRDYLKLADMPAALFAEARLRSRLWPFLKRHGSSSAHFALVDREGYALQFHGLTEAEYAEQNEEA